MGNIQNGTFALALSAALLAGGALEASAQNDEGATEVESPVAAGTLDDGADLLPRASISVDAAIEAAQSAASGVVGEIDLEYVAGVLVFNVDIGTQDVKVDAASGAVLSVDAED